MKPEVSVVIPNKDDACLLPEVVARLFIDTDPTRFEVIIVDDGSFEPVKESLFKDYPNVRVIYVKVNKGVGHSFDLGVKNARADSLLLLGSDVLIKKGDWIDHVKRNALRYQKAFTCATCVGVNPGNMHEDWGDKTRRYGADILFKMTFDDLPADSRLRRQAHYADIMQCKWIRVKRDEESYEIPGILGTCYAVYKRWYLHIGGWGWLKAPRGLTKEEKKWYGHRIWGSLEPIMSMKSWFAGGSCRVDPKWETAHVFSREVRRGVRLDMMYFNRLFNAYTLFPLEQAKKLDGHLLRGKNENEARNFIRKNRRAILAEKEYNDAIKVHGAEIFEDKFGYDMEWLLKSD